MPICRIENQKERYYYTYEEIHRQLGLLAENKLLDKHYDAIVAIGDGGLIPARILRTFLDIPIYCITVKSYYNSTTSSGIPYKHQWLDNPEKLKGLNLLLVDEIDDTRATLAYCVSQLEQHSPKSITIAVLHNKDKPKSDIAINLEKRCRYYAADTVKDKWIVYPWECSDLSFYQKEDLEEYKVGLM